MCNPRRVKIQLARAINEAFRATVEQTASATGEVRELARMRLDIPLADELGDLALDMLERVLRGEVDACQAWERDEQGCYRRTVGEVTLVYDPSTRQMMVEAALAETVSVETRATAEACGFTTGEIATEAIGRYYDDGWGGHTAARAREEAQTRAEQDLTQAIEALHRERTSYSSRRPNTQHRIERLERRQSSWRSGRLKCARRFGVVCRPPSPRLRCGSGTRSTAW